MEHEGPGKEKGSRTSFPRIPSDCVGFRGRGCDSSAFPEAASAEEYCCEAPRGQRGAPILKCAASSTWSPARVENEDHVLSKYDVSPLESGGREGIRTPGLLVANDGENKLRQGATIT